jgi:ATP-dependent helicase/nuclease subunit B
MNPCVYTIPFGEGFVDALARGLAAQADDDPLVLARMTVLLPTRRSCRSLREAFLRLSGGKPVLLPRLTPLNDLDEEEALLNGFGLGDVGGDIPPPIDPLRRQMLLASMILKRDGVSHDQAVALAAELARLIDQMQTERVSFDALRTLAPEQYAAHWQETLRFLDIVTTHWPDILRAEGCIDPVEHRNRVFASQAATWRKLSERLPGPIIAAGSTGSIPATADLLSVIARLPGGCVVLPGLDQALDDAAWAVVDETHPQFGMKHLLSHLDVARDAVKVWPGARAPTSAQLARTSLVRELMRPAEATEAWTDLSLPDEATAELHLLTGPSPREEAAAIAVAMREALNTPEHTCALITPDRTLAARVSGELERWGIGLDDSGGRDLDLTPVGVFLRLVAEMVASDFAPLPTLAACKHPLAGCGMDAAEFRKLTRAAELVLFRGPRPAPGLANLRRLAAGHGDTLSWINRLERACAGFKAKLAGPEVDVTALIETHMYCAEGLAATHDTPGPLRLWANDDGENAALTAAQLAEAASALPPIAPEAYPALFAALLKGRVVRPRYGKHPRLAVLGPLEARLQRFDTVILAGLNEGTWPAGPAPDPWLSRPMRKTCGLPSPERRIGQSAHDLAEAMCGPRVIMSRSEKADGAPSVPSRWLLRLEQVLTAAGLPASPKRDPWLDIARMLSRPESIRPWPAPEPRPPVSARPRQLSVTQVETWMRDPYAVYARHILKLRALDPIDADVSASDYGMLIHAALRKFVEGGKTTEGELIDIGKVLFAETALRPALHAFWWPRFLRIARWFVGHERARRDAIAASLVEHSGALKIGAFTLTATADRIDIGTDGKAVVIDYKTGQPPSTREVVAGYSPQLPLEAAMVLAKGFPGVGAKGLAELAFWHLHGRDEGASIVQVRDDLDKLAGEARDGLAKLIAAFDDAETPYRARPRPEFAPKYSDYEHLARVKEWASSQDGEP